MKAILRTFLFSALFISFFSAPEFYAQKIEYSSFYEGRLNIQSISLRLILKIYSGSDGSVGAMLDSPDQGAKDIPVSSISMDNDSLKFEIKAIGVQFRGEVIRDSSMIKGTFLQGGLNLPLTLKKIEKLPEIRRPQNPQRPYPYIEEEVVFENKEAKIKLAGTLTMPNGMGPFPAVVLITGSGPQDRDETLLNHKPFLVIADHLTKNGIAVLRYDDRGIGKSEGKFAEATSLDFAGDALAAMDYLQTRKEIDSKKIGLIGHSEGGLIAPIAATQSAGISYIILLAGPGVTGKEILLVQSKLISLAGEAKEEDIKEDLLLSEKIYDIILNEPDNSLAKEKVLQTVDQVVAALPAEKKKDAEKNKSQLEASFRQISSPWFRFFLKFDPRSTLENVTVPVLALNGKSDLQVWHEQNLPEIEKALKSGGNKNYKIVALDGLNHLFQHSKTGSPSEYGNIEETISPDVLKIITDWILGLTN